MAHLRGARASFLCVTETESMATVCPSPHSPASGGHLHASDKAMRAQHTPTRCEERFGALGKRGVYRGRVEFGWVRAGGEGAPAHVGGVRLPVAAAAVWMGGRTRRPATIYNMTYDDRDAASVRLRQT
jgi:hypothetical protein